MWKDMWCGRWNEKMFKDIALFSLLLVFFLTSRRGEGEFLDEEKTKKDKRDGEDKNFVTPIHARVGIASIRPRTFHFNAVKRWTKRLYSLLSIFDEKFALRIDGNRASFSTTHFNKGQKKRWPNVVRLFRDKILLGTLSRSGKRREVRARRQNANVAHKR